MPAPKCEVHVRHCCCCGLTPGAFLIGLYTLVGIYCFYLIIIFFEIKKVFIFYLPKNSWNWVIKVVGRSFFWVMD